MHVKDMWDWKALLFFSNFLTDFAHLFPLSISVSYFLPPLSVKHVFAKLYWLPLYNKQQQKKNEEHIENPSSLEIFALCVGSWAYHWELISYEFGRQFAV